MDALHERDKIVLTDALQHQEGRRTVPAVGHQVRAASLYGARFTGTQTHFLFGFAQKNSEISAEHVKSILNIVVVVPGYFLSWGNLELGNAKSRPRGVLGPALDFVEMAGVLHRLHVVLLLGRLDSMVFVRVQVMSLVETDLEVSVSDISRLDPSPSDDRWATLPINISAIVSFS
jgi:hypothetical protein